MQHSTDNNCSTDLQWSDLGLHSITVINQQVYSVSTSVGNREKKYETKIDLQSRSTIDYSSIIELFVNNKIVSL